MNTIRSYEMRMKISHRTVWWINDRKSTANQSLRWIPFTIADKMSMESTRKWTTNHSLLRLLSATNDDWNLHVPWNNAPETFPEGPLTQIYFSLKRTTNSWIARRLTSSLEGLTRRRSAIGSLIDCATQNRRLTIYIQNRQRSSLTVWFSSPSPN